MPPVPIVKLAVDLQKIEKYFLLDHSPQGGFDYDLIIDRQRYDQVEDLLEEYDIADPDIVQEFCFIILWVEKELGVIDDLHSISGKYRQMWLEIDSLKDYLLKHRITGLTFEGEHKRNKPGNPLTIKEEINIDRLCDGIRSVFRDEFQNDESKRMSKGRRKWKRRKMVKIRNNIMNYFTSIPGSDFLSLDQESDIIERLTAMACSGSPAPPRPPSQP